MMDDGASRVPERAPRSPRSWPMIALVIFAGVFALIYARALLVPVLFAFLLTLTFTPVRRSAEKIGIPPGLTAFVICASLLALLIAAFMGLSGPLRNYINNAPELMSQVEDKLAVLSTTMETVNEAGEQLTNLGGQRAEEAVVVVDKPGMFSRLATTAPFLAAQIILTLALLFFLLASGDMFYEKTVHAIPTFADKRRAVQIFYDIEAKLSRYFFTITIINAGLGVAIGFAMWWLGIPNPVLIGVLAFVFNYVPYIGAVAGIGIVTALGLLTFDTIGQAALTGFVYFLLTTLEGQFVTPWAVGKSLKLNTVVVFIAVAFWGWAWSVIGMIIAMPTLIALRTFAMHIHHLRGIEYFLSARHAENGVDEPREEIPASSG